jgi:predicted N-acetyltransferase YhbS
MIIRDLKYGEMKQCEILVRENWGIDAADRAHDQMLEMFKGGPYAPHFYVADIGSSIVGAGIIGFAGFAPDMMMNGSYDLIFVVVHSAYQGHGAGRALTEARIAEIRKRGGTMVSLMTQKPEFFRKFGFRALDVHDGWCLMNRKLATVRM